MRAWNLLAKATSLAETGMSTEPCADSVFDDAWEPLEVDPTDAERVRAMRLRVAINDSGRNALAGVLGTLIIAIFCSWDSQTRREAWGPWLWWSAYVLTGALIAQIARNFRRGPATRVRTLAFGRHLLGPIGAAGVVWGSAAWLMLPTTVVQKEMVLILGNAMTLMGVVVGRGGDRTASLAFIVPSASLFALGLCRLGDLFHVSVGLGLIVFSGALLSYGKEQQRSVETALNLRLRTQRLLMERIAQQAETERARIDEVAAKQAAQAALAQAEQANRSKNFFLAAIGHDLRQPMHAVVQYMGQLERANSDARLASPIYGANLALRSMHDLLDSILEVARLIAGTIEPKWASFPILPLINRLEAQMRPTAEAKGLTLVMCAPVAWLRSDEVLLERILRNLISNAICYTEMGRVVVNFTVRQRTLVLRIVDTGIGIPIAEQAKIFQEFYQVSNVSRDRRMGLGLGLSIVRHLASILGGDIAVRSRVGKGTIFRLMLPVLTVPAGTPSAPTARLPARYAQGSLVVLIDDSDESREATASSLALMGCRVLSAPSSADANAALTKSGEAPHMILTDYRLRDETGIEAVAAVVRAQHLSFGSDLSIGSLVVTGDTTASVENSIRAAGHPMLRKPVLFDELERAVQTVLAEVAESTLDSEPASSPNSIALVLSNADAFSRHDGPG